MDVSILGFTIHALGMEEALDRIERALDEAAPFQVVTANPLVLLAAETHHGLKDAIENAGMVLPDGIGMVLAARLHGRRISRLPGIELMERLCERASRKKKSVFLLGAEPNVADEMKNRLAARFPGLTVVGTCHGYFNPEEERLVLSQVAAARPDYLFVALPTPTQDAWIHKNLARFGAKVVVGVGGSFDVLSGRLYRAPAFMRSIACEWLFRLLQEPRRIKRMLRLPVFLWKCLRPSGLTNARHSDRIGS